MLREVNSFVADMRSDRMRRRAHQKELEKLLREPDMRDVRERLGLLAAASGRSMAEVLRVLVLTAAVSPEPPVRLADGLAIIRIRRVDPV